MENLIEDIRVLTVQDTESCEKVKISANQNTGKARKLYIESYGCQMNFSDSEIVASILQKDGFDTTSQIEEADLVFLNTCSIREKAEQTVRNRLNHINGFKKRKKKLWIW
jgi:tRNA-2-methylthio-N6-dimethylallyladenosine synthase